jgi:hypothetical protein
LGYLAVSATVLRRTKKSAARPPAVAVFMISGVLPVPDVRSCLAESHCGIFSKHVLFFPLEEWH